MLLRGLKKHPVRLTAIVSMADDGGSTGALRDQYGALPAGDIRRALVALSESSKTLRELFAFRFSKGDLHNHSFGNIFLAALEKITGNFSKSVDEASRILNVHGDVVPVTLGNVRLVARLANGHIIRGEHNIDVPKKGFSGAPIKDIWLSPAAKINPKAVSAIRSADMIVIGPGDMYTSIIPNFLVSGVPQALWRCRAKKVYVGSLMTKFGETHSFEAQDFISEVERYAGKGALDVVIFNKKRPSPAALRRYAAKRSKFVNPSALPKFAKKPRIILANLLKEENFLVRHDEKKLARFLLSLL
jgi:uncharacterized cofD-like protein